MKLVLRILPTVFVLISITAFADTVRFNLNQNVGIVPNFGIGDNVAVYLFGPGVSAFAEGGTPHGWFDLGQPYFPGDSGLGPMTIFWDTASLQIGSTGYDFDQFDLFPTDFDQMPSITFPTNGKDFTVTFPIQAWELDGTILTDCPSTGCNFGFAGKLGKLSLSYVFSDGAYFAQSASFSAPEPGTLPLMLIGIGAVCWRKFRSVRLARSKGVKALAS